MLRSAVNRRLSSSASLAAGSAARVKQSFFCSAERRRVVLSTPIAESSLTIDGVRVVVDGGFANAPRFDSASGMEKMKTVLISRSSAQQRTGRAGEASCHDLSVALARCWLALPS